MVKFLIATHGFLADGLKSSIGVLMGEEIAEKISTINAFVDGGVADPKTAIANECNDLYEDEVLIIFTDLQYGSVNQFAIPFADNKKIHIISGTNFPVLCEVISKLTFGSEEIKFVSSRDLKEIVEKAREQLVYFENQTESSNDEEDFFD